MRSKRKSQWLTWTQYFSLFNLGGAFVCVIIRRAVRMMAFSSLSFFFFFLNDKEPFYNPSNQTGWSTGPLSCSEWASSAQCPGGPVTSTTNTTTVTVPQTSCQRRGRDCSLFGNLNELQKDNQLLIRPVPLPWATDIFSPACPLPHPRALWPVGEL